MALWRQLPSGAFPPCVPVRWIKSYRWPGALPALNSNSRRFASLSSKICRRFVDNSILPANWCDIVMQKRGEASTRYVLNDLNQKDYWNALTHCALRLIEGGAGRGASQSVGDVRQLPLRVADTLYRVGQEALANAVRRAHPSIITIKLEYMKNAIHLTVGMTAPVLLESTRIRGLAF
jgi:hypothetical protein